MISLASGQLRTYLGLLTFVTAVLLGVAGPSAAHDPCVLGLLDEPPSEVPKSGEEPAPTCAPAATDPNLAFAIAADQFASVAGGEFTLAGSPFRFVGTNAYFMLDAAMYETETGSRTVQTMHLANDLGFNVLRMWGFMNADGGGVNKEAGTLQQTVNQRLLQPLPRVYNDGRSYMVQRTTVKVGRTVYPKYVVSDDPSAPLVLVTTPNYFRRLDFVIATAQRHNVRLIFTFGNNWKEYGGVDQLLKWCAPGLPRIHFFTDPECRALYKDYISYVLNRWNPLTGRQYKNEPTIFAWELMNEPRCPGCPFRDPQSTLYEWLKEMAAHVRSEVAGEGAPQMVATGEEGFDCTWQSTWVAHGYQDQANIRLHPWMYDGSQGACYGKNTRIPDIAFGSFHIWPEAWRFKNGAVSEASWISDHILIAKAGQQIPEIGDALAKLAVLGEFGAGRSRDTQYHGWLTAVASVAAGWPDAARGDGALAWQIMCPVCANHATRLEVIYPPVTRESEVLCRHAAAATQNGTTPALPLTTWPPNPLCGPPTADAYLP